MGFYNYILLHYIFLYDVNITTWPLGRSKIAEFTLIKDGDLPDSEIAHSWGMSFMLFIHVI